MSSIPTAIYAQMAQVQANTATSFVKSNAESERQIANVLGRAIENVPTSSVRGTQLDISA